MTYDLIIIGAGPAGMTASIYASRYNVSHIVIGNITGGMSSEAIKIHNWPGIQEISGFELSTKMAEHVKSLGAEIITGKVIDIRKENDLFYVKTEENEYVSKTVILATGTTRRKLNVRGEKEFTGKGVCYCATCDGPLYRSKNVAVVGGGNSGVSAAIYLAEMCPKVYLIEREKELAAEVTLQEELNKIDNIEVIREVNIKELIGDNKLQKAILDNERELEIEGVFVEIGGVPTDTLIKKLGVETDNDGYILANKDQSTNVKGVWAAGDITRNSNSFMQIITAAAEGAVAENSVKSFLRENNQ